jgi:hypothetical protein
MTVGGPSHGWGEQRPPAFSNFKHFFRSSVLLHAHKNVDFIEAYFHLIQFKYKGPVRRQLFTGIWNLKFIIIGTFWGRTT